MEQAKFLLLCGLPASGKSTFSKEVMKDRDDIIYLSSDLIRLEIYGSEEIQQDHANVFQIMLDRAKEALRNGKHVLYDATNISRKRRKGLLQQLPKNIDKTVVYMATPIDTVIYQNNNRERVVPEEAIYSMYKNMQIPVYSEGWDKIIIDYNDEILDSDFPKQFSDAVRVGVLLGREGYELMAFLATYFDEFFKIYELAQDSTYHSFTVSRHTYHVYKYILDNYNPEDESEKELLLWTALLHDTGKAFCKSFLNRKGEPTRYANFIGHDYVGSQIAVMILKRLGFDDLFIHNVATLIQFHMYLLDEKASKDKLKGYVGEQLFEKLQILRDADTQAH